MTQDGRNNEMNPAEQAVIKMKQLEAKITEFGQERSEMVQIPNALRNAADYPIVSERKEEEAWNNVVQLFN